MKESIYITNHKNSLLKTLSTMANLSPSKVYTLKEFINIYPYEYNEKTLDFIMSEEKVILEVAQKYLDNIILYPVEQINTEKGNYLSLLKQKLINNKLLQENKLLKEKFRNVIFKIDEDICSQEILFLLKDYDVEILKKEQKNYIPKIYSLNNVEEEITFVLEQVIYLIKKNVPEKNIYLTNVPNDYLHDLKRLGRQMHIPLNINTETTLQETSLGSLFLKNLPLGYEEALKKIQELCKDENDTDIYNNIVNIVNKYMFLQNKEKFIIYALRNTKRQEKNYKTGIQVVNYKTYSFKEDDYVFFLSFNSDTIPKFYKDEDYFEDNIKQKIHFDTTTDKNIKEKKFIENLITSYPHIFITFKKNTLKKEVYPSSLLEKYSIQEGHLNYNISKEYNEYIFGKLMDNYVKFGTVNDTFIKLSSNHTISYQTYDNEYKVINNEKLMSFLKNKLVLSYTHMNDFLACPFSFYLKYILKLNPYEETFNTIIGTIFHKILELKDEEEFDYDYTFQHIIKDYDFSSKEEMLLQNLKEEFRNTLNLLQEREKFTELKEREFEKEIIVPMNEKIPVTFKGKIDALYYNSESKIFKIIDYKSGMPFLDASIMPHGFSLQLPTYLYLLKNDEDFKTYTCGGFYLQPLFIDKQKCENKVDYEVTKKNALKALGYSNSNFEILGSVDSSYPNSCQIKSLKVKKDGNFYNYAKIFDKDDLNTLFDLVDNLIHQTIDEITKGQFKIEPKVLDNKKNISCEFCPFKDICFYKDKDKVYINSDKNFLKKEVKKDGMDE